MTKLAVVVCATMLAGGCARINPGFSDDESMQSSSGGGTAATTSSPGSTTTTGGTQSTGPKTTSDSSGPPPGDSSSGTTASDEGSSTTATRLCEQSPEDGAPFDVLIGGRPVPPPANCEDVLERDVGTMLADADGIYQQECDTCSCAAADGIVVVFDGSVDLPALPTCGSLLLWPGHDATGQCRWDGVAVFAENKSTIPEFFALNSRNFPVSHFGNVLIELEGESDCLNPDQCDQTPGPYDLRFFNGDVATVGDTTDVEIAFFASVPFRVHNRMTFVDSTCGEHVAWTGVQM